MSPRWDKPSFSCPNTWQMAGRRALWLLESSVRHVGAGLSRIPWVSERLRFYHAWRANPQGIGAIVPSSVRLARAITQHVDAHTGPVIELGAGTGVFTRALMKRGIAQADLALVEMDTRFAQHLAREFPQAELHAIDACRLASQNLFDGERAGATICGLPLLNLPLKTRIGIVRGSFAHLRPDGAFYFFTYGLHCPLPRRVLDRMGLRARKIDVVFANVPPAHVWRVTRRGNRQGVLSA